MSFQLFCIYMSKCLIFRVWVHDDEFSSLYWNISGGFSGSVYVERMFTNQKGQKL